VNTKLKKKTEQETLLKNPRGEKDKGPDGPLHRNSGKSITGGPGGSKKEKYPSANMFLNNQRTQKGLAESPERKRKKQDDVDRKNPVFECRRLRKGFFAFPI